MKITRKLQVLAAVLSLVLVIGLIITATSQGVSAETDGNKKVEEKNMENRVVVTGTASISVKPDVAYINVGVETLNKDAKIAQEDNAKAMNAVIAKLKENGIKDNEIQTTGYNIYERFNYTSSGSRISEGYAVEANLTVTVNDVSKAGQIFDVAVKNGANKASGITFGVKDRSKVYNQALKDAMKSAQAKAESIMSTFGEKPGKPALVEEFYQEHISRGMDYNMNYAEAKMDDSTTEIAAGELVIHCKLIVTYKY